MLSKKIVIMGIPYTLRKCKGHESVDTTGASNNLSGQVNFETRTISLHVGKEEQQEDIQDTLLHEIVHAVIYHLFRRRDDCEILFDDSIIEPFTTALLDTLIRNKICTFNKV